MKEQIKHLLIPKEFRVWCRPDKLISKEMQFCRMPSEATCANCLTRFRAATTDIKTKFRVQHAGNREAWFERQERERAERS